jgi:hypothetical protein
VHPTPLFQQVKAATDRPAGGVRRSPMRPVVRPALARALHGAAERLDPAAPIRAVGQTRQGAGP